MGRTKWSLLFTSILLLAIISSTRGSLKTTAQISSFGEIQTSEYLSALDAASLHVAKIYPGAGSFLAFIEDRMGNIDAKRQILDYVVDRLRVDAIMIGWRRQPIEWDPRDQLESPLNSGKLNPLYIKHLDEWVRLAEEYKIYIIFQEWFSPMRAKERGQWTGFDDWMFHEHWANFYRVLATHFRGNTSIAGFSPGEEVVAEGDSYPYPISGSREFNYLWNRVMTKISRALHDGDPNFNFIAVPTVDWSAGVFTLGSKAIYPNAWQPLNDSNSHVIYRVMWFPKNEIKKSTLYPFDDNVWINDHKGSSFLEGVVNFRTETGLPVLVECLVEWRETEGEGPWIWDNAGLQWLADFLASTNNEGIGFNVGTYGSGSHPYVTHDDSGNERPWVQVYGESEATS